MKRIVAIPLSVLLVLALSACGSQGSASAAQPASSQPAVVSESQPTPSSVPQSASEPAVPQPAYITDAASLAGSWLYHVPNSADNLVYQIRFDEIPGEILMSCGPYESDGGVYFRGPYSMGADGIISAQLKLSDFEVPDNTPVINVTFAGEWPAAGVGNSVVFTLLSIDTESVKFSNTFSDIVGQALSYEKLA